MGVVACSCSFLFSGGSFLKKAPLPPSPQKLRLVSGAEKRTLYVKKQLASSQDAG